MRNSPLSLLQWDVPRARTRILTALTVIAAGGVLGCEDDVVYQDRPPFNPPADAAASFLGYYDPTIQKTHVFSSLFRSATVATLRARVQ